MLRSPPADKLQCFRRAGYIDYHLMICTDRTNVLFHNEITQSTRKETQFEFGHWKWKCRLAEDIGLFQPGEMQLGLILKARSSMRVRRMTSDDNVANSNGGQSLRGSRVPRNKFDKFNFILTVKISMWRHRPKWYNQSNPTKMFYCSAA